MLWVILALLFLTSCKDPLADVGPKSSYPVDRLLHDSKGRHIDVSILGRGPDHVSFLRKSDGKRYDYLLEDLSAKDRAFLAPLPINLNALRADQRPAKKKPRFVEIRENELAGLNAEMEAMRQKLGRREISAIQERSLARDIRMLKPKIERLERQIADYWEQNPPK